MPEYRIQAGSLVLYKAGPALVTGISDKIDITLDGGKTKRVRDKDVRLLHPGPLRELSALQPGTANVAEAWELVLEETAVGFEELAELLYGEYSPATAWGAWQLVDEGLYFEPAAADSSADGLTEVRARSAEQVQVEQAERAERAAAQQAWDDFLGNVERAALTDDDRKRLAEVERVALGQSEHSRILAHFELPATAESAHRFLVRCRYWLAEHNPFPARLGAPSGTLDLPVPELPEESRRDLTHLPAYAIDDVGNQDPDDAISIDGERLWVHVADVAALVAPDDALDLAARERAANLYLPEHTISMLPAQTTTRLGLGLSEISPALSFGFRLGDEGVEDIEVMPSWVRVERLTYDDVDAQIDDPRFAPIRAITDAYRAQRLARDAARIDLPEVSVRLRDGEVDIRPLPRLRSRDMVTDAMLMAGEAAARFAQAEGLPIAYAMQPGPEEIRQPERLSEMYAYRRLFKASRAVTEPERHFGLGLPIYTRATSPLRRYLDLVTHQQLRALITGGTPLTLEQIRERIGAAEAVSGLIRRAERFSNQHWKLVWLQRNSDWQGEAVVVDLDERKATLMIPALALETKIRLQDGMALDQRVRVGIREVDLPAQDAHFRLLK